MDRAWQPSRLKFLAELRSGSSITSEDIFDEGTYPVYGGNGLGGFTDSFTHDGEYALIGRQGALCGNVHRASGRFWASEHAVVATMRGGTDAAWYAYLAESMNLGRYSVSAAQPGLAVDRIRELPVGVPALAIQRAIADFLDEKTAAIDTLIEKKRKLLDLLAEERAALINQAVTKGLDPSVPMKDSGIPWIGEVPAHWSLLQLRRVLTRIEQGWSPQCDSRPANPEEWRVLKAGCTAGGRFEPEENKTLPNGTAPRCNIEVRPGDIVMSRASGSPKIVGSVALVENVRPRLLLSDKLFRLRFDSRSVDASFIVASLASGPARAQIENAISGAEGLANNLPQAKIREIVIALPPLAEQQQIGEYLSVWKKRIESVGAAARMQLDRLHEYRQTFITAAVTGQLDIGAAA